MGSSGAEKDEKPQVAFSELNQQHFRGRRKRCSSEEEGQETHSKAGEYDHGRWGPHAVGEERDWRKEPQGLQGRARRFQVLCPTSGAGCDRCILTRPAPDHLHEQDIPGRLSSLSGGSPGCSSASLPPAVWKNGIGEAAKNVEGAERIPKADARSQPSSLPLNGVGGAGVRAPPCRQASDGLVPPRVTIQLCQALGGDPASDLLLGEASAWSDIQLVSADESRRARGAIEDGGIRQQCGLGLSMAVNLGSDPLWISQGEPSSDSALGLRLFPVLPSLQDSSHHLGSGFDSISDPAFRSFNRQSQELQNPTRSPKGRAMEIPAQCHEISDTRSLHALQRPWKA